jgi:hypothetical protein
LANEIVQANRDSLASGGWLSTGLGKKAQPLQYRGDQTIRKLHAQYQKLREEHIAANAKRAAVILAKRSPSAGGSSSKNNKNAVVVDATEKRGEQQQQPQEELEEEDPLDSLSSAVARSPPQQQRFFFTKKQLLAQKRLLDKIKQHEKSGTDPEAQRYAEILPRAGAGLPAALGPEGPLPAGPAL